MSGYSTMPNLTQDFYGMQNYYNFANQYPYINNYSYSNAAQPNTQEIIDLKKLDGEATKNIDELNKKKKQYQDSLGIDPKKSKNNEKLGFWEGLGHVGLGVLKSIPKMLGCEWDSKGKFKFNLGKCLTTVGVAVGTIAAATGAVALGIVSAPFVAGALMVVGVAGGIMIGAHALKSGAGMFDKTKTKADRINDCENFGDDLAQIGLCFAGMKGVKGERMLNAKGFASELLGKVPEGDIALIDAVKALENTNGSRSQIKAAISKLRTLVKNKEGYEEFAQLLGKAEKVNPALINAESQAKLTRELASIAGNAGEDAPKIQAIFDSVYSATNKGELFKALKNAEKLLAELNTTDKKGLYNNLEVILADIKVPFKPSLGKLLRPDMKGLAPKNVAQTVKTGAQNFKENPIQGTVLAHRNALAAKSLIQQQDDLGRELDQAALATIEENLKTQTANRIKILKELAAKFNIDVTDIKDDDTNAIKKLEAKIKAKK